MVPLTEEYEKAEQLGANIGRPWPPRLMVVADQRAPAWRVRAGARPCYRGPTVMDPDERARSEAAIRRHHEAGELASAATLAIERYGPEILGYIAALARPGLDTDDIFATFTEALWLALPRFRWDSSFRTWAYAIARYTLLQARRSARTRALRAVTGDPQLDQLVAHARSSTAPHLRSSVKLQLEHLRAQLDDDDHTLLILRVDRRLSWRAIAEIMASHDSGAGTVDDAALRRDAAALRKRFERLKAQLGSRLRTRG